MKKTLILLLLALCVGCGRETPIVSNSFVISKIVQYKSGCMYISKNVEAEFRNNVSTAFTGADPGIVLPCGLYQIGDTIKPKDFK